MNDMKPMPVDDAKMVFPGAVAHMMPKREEIPEEFFRSAHPTVKIAEMWFYEGIPRERGHFVAADGIKAVEALRHLKCVLGSFEPEHNHKIAAAAYLLAQWFDEITVGETRWKKP